METTSSSPISEVLKHAPQWFVALFALVYLSGYLIDFYDASAFGIVESSGDLLKLKYIQTGLNFILLLAIIAGPSLFEILRAFSMIARRPAQTESEVRKHLIRLFVSTFTIAYTLSIYISFLFTPAHHFQHDLTRIVSILLLIFLVQITYIFVTRIIDDKRQAACAKASIKGEAEERRSVLQMLRTLDRFDLSQIFLCIFLLIATFAADYQTLAGVRRVIFECIVHRGWIFFAFCVLLGALLNRAVVRGRNPPIPFVQYLIVMISSTLVIFYLSLVSYAYFIFPYIPSVKGGSDFTGSAYVNVVLRSDVRGRSQVDHLIYVYGGAALVYFATPLPNSGPCNWRRRESLPKLVAFEYRSIERIDFEPAGSGSRSPC